MITPRQWLPACVLSFLLFPAVAAELRAQAASTEMAAGDEATVIVSAADLEFAPLEVPGFASGMQVAVLSGDPYGDGEYTLRLAFPDGYEFPPHWHPMAENVTVVKGTFLLGMGGSVDESAIKEYSPGDYLHIPPEHPHFGGAKGWTVVQLHGTGPFAINLVE